MPEITYIVRLYCHDGFVEEYEQYDLATAEELFHTFAEEDYESVELLSYDYATHTETLIKQN